MDLLSFRLLFNHTKSVLQHRVSNTINKLRFSFLDVVAIAWRQGYRPLCVGMRGVQI